VQDYRFIVKKQSMLENNSLNPCCARRVALWVPWNAELATGILAGLITAYDTCTSFFFCQVFVSHQSPAQTLGNGLQPVLLLASNIVLDFSIIMIIHNETYHSFELISNGACNTTNASDCRRRNHEAHILSLV